MARRAGVAAAALALLLTAWLAPRALAQAGEEAPAEPRFPIERITVEGARHASAELIVSESLLTEGRSYSEDELRQAVYRIQRLPFLVDTRFALRKGSERGSYELVITVEEASPVFLGLDATGLLASGALDRSFAFGTGTVGARWFVDAQSVLFFAVEGDEAQIGYTHYNLLGRRIFATAAYGRRSKDFDGLIFEWDDDDTLITPADLSLDSERVTLLLGFPLTTNQTLRFGASSTDEDFGESTFSLFRRSSRAADVRWIYDTTDDPVVPTRGQRAEVGFAASRETSRSELAFPGSPTLFLEQEAEGLGVTGGYRRYRPLSGRQSIWLGGKAAVTNGEIRTEEQPFLLIAQTATTITIDAEVGHSVGLWGAAAARRWGDLRFESSLASRYGYTDASGSRDDGGDFAGVAVTAGLVLRNRWGLFRFGVSGEVISGED